ncbi:hypothetical protein AgCh_025934 [Apium graveolens]
MKAGTFSLNPYAASYIPISRRGISDENKGFEVTENASRSVDGPQPVISTTNNQYQMARQSYNVQGTVSEDSKLKSHSVHGSSSQYPNEMTEKQKLDEQSDMDLTYLQLTFPGVSDDSLSVAYLANSGDLDATIDMLVQLEVNF